ncbi:Short-chain dehydrogenase, partial [Globisporangium splendens]
MEPGATRSVQQNQSAWKEWIWLLLHHVNVERRVGTRFGAADVLYAAHPIWKAPLFASKVYGAYAAEAAAAQSAIEMLASLSLKQTVLQLVDHLQVQHSQLTTTIKSEVAVVKSRIGIIEQRVTQLVSGDASISRSINWRDGSHATTSQDLQASASPTLCKMNRNISTVPDLSGEWCTGFQGGPSITQLNQNHGATWRESAGEILKLKLKPQAHAHIRQDGERQHAVVLGLRGFARAAQPRPGEWRSERRGRAAAATAAAGAQHLWCTPCVRPADAKQANSSMFQSTFLSRQPHARSYLLHVAATLL